jgi:hypothetical protein
VAGRFGVRSAGRQAEVRATDSVYFWSVGRFTLADVTERRVATSHGIHGSGITRRTPVQDPVRQGSSRDHPLVNELVVVVLVDTEIAPRGEGRPDCADIGGEVVTSTLPSD